MSVEDFLNTDFTEAVYVQLDVLDYCERIDGKHLGKSDFFQHPEAYRSTFERFTARWLIYLSPDIFMEKEPLHFSHVNKPKRAHLS